MLRVATIRVTASRKVGEPNYGSRAAEVSLEIEIPANEQADIQTVIVRAYAQATKAVDDQLARTEPASKKSPGPQRPRLFRPAHQLC